MQYCRCAASIQSPQVGVDSCIRGPTLWPERMRILFLTFNENVKALGLIALKMPKVHEPTRL